MNVQTASLSLKLSNAIFNSYSFYICNSYIKITCLIKTLVGLIPLTMTCFNILRYSLLIISICLFFYQIHQAVSLLINPPKLDTSVIKDLSEVDLPQILVCASQQYENDNWKSIKKIGSGFNRWFLGERKYFYLGV